MFSPAEEIKSRLNIVDVVGGYVKLDKAGSAWKALCPFHRERTPSFTVNEERQMWHCFGCNKGGDVFAFVMEMEGMDFREALRLLADRAGVTLSRGGDEQKYVEEKNEKERLFALLEQATKFYEKQLWDGEGKKVALPYLLGRGLTEESLRAFRIGFAPPGWRHAGEFLQKLGYAPRELEQAGMSLKSEKSSGHYDRFRERIMFPIFDVLGRVIGYSARVLPGADDAMGKYINTPETTVYRKSHALYGLYLAKQAIKEAGHTVVVEGNMDVIACHQAGIANTVAVSGTALTDEQLTILKRYAKEIRFFFDMDAAGQKAARRSVELALAQDISASIITIPEGKDAADINKEHPEALREAVAKPVPALAYFLEQILAAHGTATPDAKKRVLDDYMALLAAVKHPLEREHYAKAVARALEVEEKMLHGVLHAARVERERRMAGMLPSPHMGEAGEGSEALRKRSERLREELVGILLAFPKVREKWLAKADPMVREYLGKHALFFFILQAGESDPVSLMEDMVLKSSASKLLFHTLSEPRLESAAPEEREALAVTFVDDLEKDLRQELLGKDRLQALEKEIREAQAAGDKDRARTLLEEFVSLSKHHR